MEIIIIALLLAVLILLVWIASSVKQAQNKEPDLTPLRDDLLDRLSATERNQLQTLLELSKTQSGDMHELQTQLLRESSKNQKEMQQDIRDYLFEIMQMNEKKLMEIEKNVNEKLDTSLNKRLDSSFKQIGDQLSTLYKSLGELQSLSSGMTDLQKTLSNVKTRGIFGEMLLGNLLANIFDSSQYEENVATKKNSADRVEFAVKIPDKDDTKDFLYLPIDSKFPADIYNKIVDASEAGDSDALKTASKELEQRIKTEARTIRDKYLNPPHTTDFAIMFLPTEGLYSEVLRIPGLVEWCQNECKIVISGPTTLSALLNSLSIGFRYLTVNKNSKDILKTLSAIKAQYDKFGQLIAKTQKKLQEAQNVTEDLKSRSDMIQKRLAKVEAVDMDESDKLLGILENSEEE